jgi:GNAT superfamily N-acetyltransferase
MTRPTDDPQVVTAERADTAVRILVDSFYRDPLWSWAMPDDDRRRAQHRAVWALFVEAAVPHSWVWLTGNGSATSLWIPPGVSELTDEQAEQFEPMLVDLMGAGAARVLQAFDVLDQGHPHDEPHYYLSLLGTDPARLGHGYGLGLLAANLRRIDELGLPAYLEASNEANVPLYARYGFRPRARLVMPDDGPDVVTMWRDPA